MNVRFILIRTKIPDRIRKLYLIHLPAGKQPVRCDLDIKNQITKDIIKCLELIRVGPDKFRDDQLKYQAE